MRKAYADLHLRLNAEEPDKASRMIEKASKLGYSLVATPTEPDSEMQLARLRKLCKEKSIDSVSRIDLSPRSPDDLLHALRKFRRSFELIGVMCDSKPVARQAAKDRRVDLLSFISHDYGGGFDLADAELAKSGLASLEVDVCGLLLLEGPARSRLLSGLQREVRIARAFEVPVVLSSGASEEWMMRKPREMAALSSLFDVSTEEALKAVSNCPIEMVERNRRKLDSRFVAPGIRVVRRGKNC